MHVLAKAGGHIRHYFSDGAGSMDGFFGVGTGKQAATEEAVVTGAHVVVVRCRSRQTLVRQVGEHRFQTGHADNGVVLLAHHHGDPHKGMLAAFIYPTRHAVTQRVLITTLLQLIPGAVEIALVIDQCFDAGVFLI
ncbi:hypothetical protein D9M70_345830 [compost metagenome]